MLQWFLSKTAEPLRQLDAAAASPSLQRGRTPSVCHSGPAGSYPGIFIFDCKAWFVLCTIPTAISLGLSFMLEISQGLVILQETKYE